MLGQILALIVPVVMEEITKLRARGIKEPTTEQVQQAVLDRSVEEGEAEAAEFRRTHPREKKGLVGGGGGGGGALDD